MKVGDVIKLRRGPVNHFGLKSYMATLIKKVPRADDYEYDWLVLADGKFIALGRQIEYNGTEVISESR